MVGRGTRAADDHFQSPMLARTLHQGTFDVAAAAAAVDDDEIDALVFEIMTAMVTLFVPVDAGLAGVAGVGVAAIQP